MWATPHGSRSTVTGRLSVGAMMRPDVSANTRLASVSTSSADAAKQRPVTANTAQAKETNRRRFGFMRQMQASAVGELSRRHFRSAFEVVLQQFDIRLDHQFDQVREFSFRFPAELAFGFAVISD